MYHFWIAAIAGLLFCGSANADEKEFLPGVWHSTINQFLVKGESWFVFEEEGTCRQYSRGTVAGIKQHREISCKWVVEGNALVLKVHDPQSGPDAADEIVRASIKHLGKDSMEFSDGGKTQTWKRVKELPPEYRQ